MMDTYLRQSLEAWAEVFDELSVDMDRWHARLFGAAEQVRRWREEDRRNGIIWSDENG